MIIRPNDLCYPSKSVSRTRRFGPKKKLMIPNMTAPSQTEIGHGIVNVDWTNIES